MARVKKQGLLGLFVFFLLIFTLLPQVKAWTKTDFEIFDIVDALEKAEGKDTTFYSLLGVKSTATVPEINKAYRKLSLKMHPDKNKGDVNAKERFARLGVIVSILRDSSKRDRYNFFYKNGVPRWRGTGYLYSRFRPGLGSVIVLLCLIASGMQYIAGQVNYRQQKNRIFRLIKDARANLETSAPKGRAPSFGKTFVEISGRPMRCEVKDNHLVVYPDERTGEPVHMNPEWVPVPTFQDIFIISLPKRLYNSFMKKNVEEVENVENVEEIVEKKPKNIRKRGAPKINK